MYRRGITFNTKGADSCFEQTCLHPITRHVRLARAESTLTLQRGTTASVGSKTSRTFLVTLAVVTTRQTMPRLFTRLRLR